MTWCPLRLAAAALLTMSLAVPPATAQPLTFVKVADGFTPIPGRSGELFTEAGGDDCQAFSNPAEAPAVDGGEVVFYGRSDTEPSYEGISSWQSGAVSTVADVGATPPGISAALFDLTWAPTIRGGATGIWGRADEEAVLHEEGGVLTEVARIGDPAPGGSTFGDFGESPAAGSSSSARPTPTSAAAPSRPSRASISGTAAAWSGSPTRAPSPPGATTRSPTSARATTSLPRSTARPSRSSAASRPR